ncbi:MAG: 2-oxoacid:acceptor oxidoreductase family protein [Patescibacteria group bacterium]|nr:2-oxoacid:acceptor oxidoreductase family protein [Patescibacteria group bacterium]
MQNKNKYEIIIHGRGGQGAKTTAEILVQAAVGEGKYVQAFPEFGPERSGAPIRSFVRISDEPIRTHEPVTDPDCVLVLDDTILDVVDVTPNLSDKEPLVINSKKGKQELGKQHNFSGIIIPVDASGMSLEVIGENRPNTVILGKFAFVTEVVKIEGIVEVFRKKYESKIGKEKTDKNVEAIMKAYNTH